MTNRKGRNREASERKGRKKATKNGEKGSPSKGVTKKSFFRFVPSISTRSLRLSSVFLRCDGVKRLFYLHQSDTLFIQNTCDFFGTTEHPSSLATIVVIVSLRDDTGAGSSRC